MIFRRSFLFIFFLFVLCLNYSWASDLKVVLAVSEKIKPYYEAVDGFMAEMDKAENVSIELLEIWKAGKSNFETRVEKLAIESYVYWVAVGPEAVRLIGEYRFPSHIKRVYSMILDPGKFILGENYSCGISLAISPVNQLRSIEKNLPWCRRVSLLYNPENNSLFADQVTKKNFKVKVKLLKVFSRQDIAKMLGTNLTDIDLLWMIPDPTVISETLVPYIIKRAMEKKVAVLGFNRFFLKKGAAASFIIDYNGIGRKTARMVNALHDGMACTMAEPPWTLNIDKGVINLLGK
jgi:putative ABC transport system substrate-binding protein